MNERFLSTSAVTYKSEQSAQVVIKESVLRLMDHPERIAWFVDEDTGLVYAVPQSEVGLR